MDNHIDRRRAITIFGAAGALTALAGCGNSFGGSSASNGEGVKVGLLIPQSGVYAPLGTDMQRGWDLWFEVNGDTLGGHEVTTVTADEGEDPQTGVPAAQKLLQDDGCDVLVGIVNSATALGTRDLIEESQKLLIIANAGADDITASGQSPYIWRTSFTNAQVAAAMGANLAESDAADGVFIIAPDYAAGDEALEGFKTAFTDGGGTIAGEDNPPFGSTQDYEPFLSRIRASGAEATFCFFAGSEAVSFVQQYREFGLFDTIPLYGSGFLTEGDVLAALGDEALGVRTTLHYTPDVDNTANEEFVQAYLDAYEEEPTVYSVQAWDAANVLNRALEAAEDLDGDSLAESLDGLDSIDDSPRGPWEFDGQSPNQMIYLREVEERDGEYKNTLVEELGVFGQGV